jgi:hypothetical protein
VNVCGLCEEQLGHGHLCPGCTLATLERLNRMPGLWRSLENLEDWYSAMRVDRGWARPVKDRPDGEGFAARVEVVARALVVNLEWMAAYWWPVGEFAKDLRRLEGEVLSIVDPRDPRERGRRFGYCVAINLEGGVCGAVLRLYEGETALTCRWCRYVYQPTEFLLLRHFQPDQTVA